MGDAAAGLGIGDGSPVGGPSWVFACFSRGGPCWPFAACLEAESTKPPGLGLGGTPELPSPRIPCSQGPVCGASVSLAQLAKRRAASFETVTLRRSVGSVSTTTTGRRNRSASALSITESKHISRAGKTHSAQTSRGTVDSLMRGLQQVVSTEEPQTGSCRRASREPLEDTGRLPPTCMDSQSSPVQTAAPNVCSRRHGHCASHQGPNIDGQPPRLDNDLQGTSSWPRGTPSSSPEGPKKQDTTSETPEQKQEPSCYEKWKTGPDGKPHPDAPQEAARTKQPSEPNVIAVYLFCVLRAKYDLLLDTKGCATHHVTVCDYDRKQVLCECSMWMVCGFNTPPDEGSHFLHRGALSTQTLQEASSQRFQKQFVLLLRDPHLLEVDLVHDPPISTFVEAWPKSTP